MLRFAAILNLFALFSCQQTKDNVNDFKVEIISEQLRRILSEYNREVLQGKDHTVITINIDNSSDTTILTLSSFEEPYQSFLMENMPGFFTLHDNRPVLIYTGYEELLSFNETYISEFGMLMNNYWIETKYMDDELQIPPNYNPVTWKIKIFNNVLIDQAVLPFPAESPASGTLHRVEN